MATLLLWIHWNAEPDDGIWQRLRSRAQSRSLYRGIERSGPGYRLFAARTRELEPEVLLERSDSDGRQELLLLDRSNGIDDRAHRREMEWSDNRLLDGTPTAAIRFDPTTLHATLYRDIMGQRALVFVRLGGQLLIASGVDVPLAHPQVDCEFDDLYLAAYFCAVPPGGNETVYRSIRRVCPGQTITFDETSVRQSRRLIEPDDSWKAMSDADVIAHFGDLFEASVVMSCIGTRRVAVFLSAGMDSGSIAAVASRQRSTNLIAITHALPDFPDIDESHMVADLCRELRIELRSVRCDRLFPFADRELRPITPDSPSQWRYREWYESACRELRDSGADVWLGGGFGDHLFSCSNQWITDALRFGRHKNIWTELSRVVRRRGWTGLREDRSIRHAVSRLLKRNIRMAPRLDWLQPPWQTRLMERLKAEADHYRDFPRPQQCALVLGADDAFNTDSEQWYAARHGMEQRLPFRDPALSRFCLSLPADFFRREGREKWLLRQAMQGILPEWARLRPKGSDLSPVHLQAIHRQSESLNKLEQTAHPFAHRYWDKLQPNSIGIGAQEVRQWLLISFAAWLQR